MTFRYEQVVYCQLMNIKMLSKISAGEYNRTALSAGLCW